MRRWQKQLFKVRLQRTDLHDCIELKAMAGRLPWNDYQQNTVVIMQIYAKFTLHDFSPIFHTLTGFDKSQTNARYQRQIGARSREWQSCSVNYQRRDLRSSPMRRRHPQNIWNAKYLELSAIHNPAEWMSSDWKIHQWWPTANERARYRAAGSSGRTF